MLSRRTPIPIAVTLALALGGLTACESPPEPDLAHIADLSLAHAPSADLDRALAALRAATAPYHRLSEAVRADYDTPITPCWEHGVHGGMGFHYANTELIDGTVELLEPEALMYVPQRGGHLRLVGMEYIVPIDEWEGAEPPTLLGQTFQPHSTLPIYKLHIWLWRNNPQGIFADWNPAVSCDFADDKEIF